MLQIITFISQLQFPLSGINYDHKLYSPFNTFRYLAGWFSNELVVSSFGPSYVAWNITFLHQPVWQKKLMLCSPIIFPGSPATMWCTFIPFNSIPDSGFLQWNNELHESYGYSIGTPQEIQKRTLHVGTSYLYPFLDWYIITFYLIGEYK